MKKAGVPVEARVEAILRPTCPDLPMPVTTTRPRVSSIIRNACRKASPRRPCNARTASASISRTPRASSRKRSASARGWGCSRLVTATNYKSIDSRAPRNATMHDALSGALILLGSAVLVVVLFRHPSFPATLGYLIVGALVGPSALALVPATENQRYLGEFGVLFLMFSVGLEFSLPQLMSMPPPVFRVGGGPGGLA